MKELKQQYLEALEVYHKLLSKFYAEYIEYYKEEGVTQEAHSTNPPPSPPPPPPDPGE